MPHARNPERGPELDTPGIYYARPPEPPKMPSVDSGRQTRSNSMTWVLGVLTTVSFALASWSMNKTSTHGEDIATVKAQIQALTNQFGDVGKRLDKIDNKLDTLLERRP